MGQNLWFATLCTFSANFGFEFQILKLPRVILHFGGRTYLGAA